METEFKAGKYLTFRVGRQDFAMNGACVRGILPVHQMTAAESDGLVCGFSVIGGRDFPVIDLPAKLGILPGLRGREPFIIVFEIEGRFAGFIADRVSEVVDLRVRDFRNGAIRSHGRPRRLLEPSQIIREEDWTALPLNP